MSFKFCHFETIWKISQGHCGPLTPFLQFRHLLLQSRQVYWVTFFTLISQNFLRYLQICISLHPFNPTHSTPGQSSKVGGREGAVQPEAAAATAWERRAQLVCLTGCLVAVNLPAVSVMLWIRVSFQKLRRNWKMKGVWKTRSWTPTGRRSTWRKSSNQKKVHLERQARSWTGW